MDDKLLHRALYLTSSNNTEDRRQAASIENLPIRYRRMLAFDKEESVRLALATVKGKLQNEITLILANDDSSAVRMYLAYRKDLSDETYDDLARDLDARVRVALASNRSIPKSTYLILTKDKDGAIQAVLANSEKDNGVAEVDKINSADQSDEELVNDLSFPISDAAFEAFMRKRM